MAGIWRFSDLTRGAKIAFCERRRRASSRCNRRRACNQRSDHRNLFGDRGRTYPQAIDKACWQAGPWQRLVWSNSPVFRSAAFDRLTFVLYSFPVLAAVVAKAVRARPFELIDMGWPHFRCKMDSAKKTQNGFSASIWGAFSICAERLIHAKSHRMCYQRRDCYSIARSVTEIGEAARKSIPLQELQSGGKSDGKKQRGSGSFRAFPTKHRLPSQ